MGKLTVVGVGLTRGDLTFAAAQALESGARIILHTDRIECADYLREKGIAFDSLDALYEACSDFEEHAQRAAEAILNALRECDVVYAVYDVRDRSVSRLIALGAKPSVIAGPPTEGALFAFADGAVRTFEASDWENFRLSARENTLIRELNSRELAGEVKLRLLDCYPDETRALVRFGDGRIARAPLYDLDRLKGYDHRCCVLVPAVKELTSLERFGTDELREVMHILQGENGCAWDRVQTHETLRHYLLEETYEAIEAIDAGDPQHLCEELGDILMQLVMHAELGARHGQFTFDDVTSEITAKMISRHTHVFGDDSTQDAEEVLKLWTKNKMKERGQKTYAEILREVSHAFPALLRGLKVSEKAARAGDDPGDRKRIVEEIRELSNGLAEAPDEKNVGELLFKVCALCAIEKLEPELALNAAIERFIDAFEARESALHPGEAM